MHFPSSMLIDIPQDLFSLLGVSSVVYAYLTQNHTCFPHE